MHEAISNLFHEGRRFQLKKSEVILRPGDPPGAVYLIEKGYIKSYTISGQASENLHIIRSTGEIFPLMWALGHEHEEMFYQAMAPTAVIRISTQSLLSNLSDDEELAAAVNQQMIGMLDIYSDRIVNLQLRSARKKLAHRLLALKARFGRKFEGSAYIIDAPIHNYDVADSVAISRETASREMVAMEKKGLIGYQKKRIVIFKPNRLADIAEINRSV